MTNTKIFNPKAVKTGEDLRGRTAVVYCRVSTEKQDSFHMQETELRKFAKTYEITILKVYHETGHAGTKNDEIEIEEFLKHRPMLKEIVYEAKCSEWQVLLVLSLDRIARDNFFQTFLTRTLYHKGIVIFSPKQSQSEVLREIEGVLSKEELRKLRIRTRTQLQDLVTRGFWIHTKPFGYAIKRTNYSDKIKQKLSKLVVKESEAMIVKNIFKQYSEGQNINKISKEAGLSFQRVEYILKNITYLGHTKHKGEVDDGIFEDFTIKNTHPPLIEEETFNRVQEQLSKNKAKRNHKLNKLIAELK